MAVGMLVVFALLARLFFGPIDNHPASIKFVSNQLLVHNQYGFELASIPLSPSLTGSYFRNYDNFRDRNLLYDLNQDGYLDLIYTNRETEQGRQDFLSGYDVKNQQQLWKKQIAVEVSFPKKTSSTSNSWGTRKIKVLQETKQILVSLVHHGYFPNAIVALNPSNGRFLSTYLHTGKISDFKLLNLDNDSTQELIFCGVNNGLDQAVVGVLDVNKLHGYGPTNGDHTPAGLPRAKELNYITLPHTKIAALFDQQAFRKSADRIYTFKNQNNPIRIVSTDVELTVNANHGDDIQFSVFFDRDLNPSGVGTSDTFDYWNAKLHREGKLPHQLDYDYFQHYITRLNYWNGREWVHEPTPIIYEEDSTATVPDPPVYIVD
jgi:hypothetical protein